jgi:hypothetical protein
MATIRTLQHRCTNCNYIYFIKYTKSDKFCSLDCKTSYQYKNHITEFIINNIIPEESINDLISYMSDEKSTSYINNITKSLN